jgi:hypothetical protein
MNGISIENNKKSLLASSSLSKSISGSSLLAKRLLVQKAQSFHLKNNNSGNEDTHERLQLVANQLAQKIKNNIIDARSSTSSRSLLLRG